MDPSPSAYRSRRWASGCPLVADRARSTAWREVKAMMRDAGVSAAAASPRGLRHTFGVHAVRSGIPLNLLQRWLGQASMATTAIYADMMGAEEHEIAARMW